MIKVKKSPTADTRTCDVSRVTRDELLAASERHIADVRAAMAFFQERLGEAARDHDEDKILLINWFFSDFKKSFAETGWWDNHRKITRHHLEMADGVPTDVNLIDVLEHISDAVMAGMARSGEVRPVALSNELLQQAVANTVLLLLDEVEIEE